MLFARPLTSCCSWVGVGLSATNGASPSLGRPRAWQDFIDTAIFGLVVLHLDDVLQTVDGASEVDFPDGWVRLVTKLSRVQGPFFEKCSIPFAIVPALLGMDPRDLKYGLVLV